LIAERFESHEVYSKWFAATLYVWAGFPIRPASVAGLEIRPTSFARRG